VLPIKDNVPTRTFPVVNDEVLRFGYYPCTVEGSCVQPASLVPHLPWYEGVFSSMFLHGGWLHVGGNMLFLWIFGNNVEDSLGHLRFFVWYLVAGIAATAAQTAVTLAFANDAGASIPNVGASGAIAGVLGAYFVLLPRASVLTLFIIVFIPLLREIPAVWFLGVWILFQLYDGGFELLHPQSGGGTAFFAHIGGFVFGVLTIRLLAERPPLRSAW
jgi:rhomboid family protein